MEAKELRIGNYVFGQSDKLVKEGRGQRSKIYQLQTINSQTPCKYDPIPLTEEWLLNFGFEMGENKSWENFNFGLTLYKDGDYFEFDQLPVFIFLKYVHQLQNLYFALTGEELTLSK